MNPEQDIQKLTHHDISWKYADDNIEVIMKKINEIIDELNKLISFKKDILATAEQIRKIHEDKTLWK